MQCHRFDERLVGPPLADVLPLYKPNIDALKAFIANPTKRNPDYPPMPNPGLSSTQVGAVSEFVMKELKKYEGAAPGGGE
jgi:cytochrome c